MQGIKAEVRAGVRSIEHGTLVDAEGLRLMLERSTFLVPTIFIGEYYDKRGSNVRRISAQIRCISVLERQQTLLPLCLFGSRLIIYGSFR